jgi:alkanesulfonate monooxygenase SsuD/methylene tetrahydromethanopterin reductase-like flavin-dependent oxidoreductase (luciferase family)
VSWLYIALLAVAVVLVAGAEWPRLGKRFGVDSRRRRERARRKARFHVVRDDRDDEADEFAASVERDLANLPTIDDRERRKG